MRVLVVEDNGTAAGAIAELLRGDGHDAEVAADGRTALARAAADPPDVVFLDIGMPDMDGWQIAERLHALDAPKRPLIVALTGRCSEEDFLRSKEAGIDLHLTKPADPRELQAILTRFQSVIQG